MDSLSISEKPKALETIQPTEIFTKFSLKGKVAVVTGGARGLGFSMAEGFCQAGLKGIAILDVLAEHGDKAVQDLFKQYGVPAQFYKVDVRDEVSVQEAMIAIEEDFGHIDVLLCSAGIADSNINAETYDVGMFRRLIDINLTGTFLCAQAAGRAMINRGKGGSIIFIASMSGHIVNWPQGQCCYNASKAAVSQLGKSLAAEWAGHKIRVNMISPGYMDTALNRVPALEEQKSLWKSRTPMARLGDVDELNGLALFLASEASTFVTGADILADGGYTLW